MAGLDLVDGELFQVSPPHNDSAPVCRRNRPASPDLCGGRRMAAWADKMNDKGQPKLHLRAVVAIPVCNEEERIGACLDALRAQAGLSAPSFGILLFLNNCTDRTAEIVAAASAWPWQLRVIARDHAAASAGWARRLALEAAAAWLREGGNSDGVLLTSDADSRVAPDWVARNLAAIAAGADAVAGRLALDPEEAALLPARLHERGRLEARYETLLTELCARLDPEPGNPWPCHWSKSGATIALTLTAFETVGGVPERSSGEDHALIDAVAAHGLVVRHDPDIVVVTSSRLDGRAAGGVAETLRRRCEHPQSFCDDRLEPVWRVVLRSRLRRKARQMQSIGMLRQDEKLRYTPLRPRQLPLQIALASCLLNGLHLQRHGRTSYRSRGRMSQPTLSEHEV